MSWVFVGDINGKYVCRQHEILKTPEFYHNFVFMILKELWDFLGVCTCWSCGAVIIELQHY